MSKEEFIRKMKELGWQDSYINECIDIKEKAEKNGIIIPYELNLFEAIIND